MQIEYINYSYELLESDLVKILEEINSIPEINTIILPQFFIKTAKNISKDKQISCLIDFPMGLSDLKSRSLASTNAVKNMADTIDIVIPSNYLTNRKYEKIREDIKNQKSIISKPRYIVEYRSYDHNYLKKITEILYLNDLDIITISTGQHIDNLADSMIASQFLKSHVIDLKVILSANFWNERHFDMILKHQPFGIRSSSLHIIKSFIDYAKKRSTI